MDKARRIKPNKKYTVKNIYAVNCKNNIFICLYNTISIFGVKKYIYTYIYIFFCF